MKGLVLRIIRMNTEYLICRFTAAVGNKGEQTDTNGAHTYKAVEVQAVMY